MKHVLIWATAGVLLAIGSTSGADTVVPVDAVESYVNIRSAPDAGAEVIGRLATGDSLVLISESDGWNEVQVDDDTVGYISADWTRVITAEATESDTEIAEDPVPEPAAEAVAETVEAEPAAPVAEPQPVPVPEPAPEPEPQPELQVDAAPNADEEPAPEPEPAVEPEPAPQPEPAPEPVVEVQAAADPVTVDDVVPEPQPVPVEDTAAPVVAQPSGLKGKPGYLARFKKETEAESSQVFDNGNQVGIGTTEPKQRLEVNGSLQIHDRNSSVAGLMITQSSGETGYLMHNRANTLTIGAGSLDRITIDRNGNVGIGVTRPEHPLQMASGAHVTAGGVWVNSSSRANKQDIRELTTADALQVLEALEPVHYSYRADAGEAHLGFIAEDVPDLVATGDRKGLASMDIVAVLTRVIQEQQKQIEALEARITAAESAR